MTLSSHHPLGRSESCQLSFVPPAFFVREGGALPGGGVLVIVLCAGGEGEDDGQRVGFERKSTDESWLCSCLAGTGLSPSVLCGRAAIIPSSLNEDYSEMRGAANE